MKQQAYARRIFGADGSSKTQIAREVGYSPYVANSASSKIESTRGFNNAVAKLANDSNNVALQILHKFKARGVKEFSNKDLVGALNAIGGAWSKFNHKAIKEAESEHEKLSGNKLRHLILQQVENQTITTQAEVVEKKAEEVDLGF